MHMKKASIREVDVANKRVLVRVDLNAPLDAQQCITDDTRIVATLPTIRYLLDRGARVILMSHLGRPKGKVVEALRLAPIARRLSELLGRPVYMANDCIGPEVEDLEKRGEIVCPRSFHTLEPIKKVQSEFWPANQPF